MPCLKINGTIMIDPVLGKTLKYLESYLFTGLAPAAGLCRRVVVDCGELY
jgi:hypothetical protein